ncbi:MAG: hypothetical protein ACRD2I_07135 [Vicinamibacterales bacterium]
MTADEYLYETEETNRIRELAGGRVCEPPAPFFSHQSLVLAVAKPWSDHVEPRRLGRVADPSREIVTVFDFAGPSPIIRAASGTGAIRSTVLPDLEWSASELFA